MDRDNRQSTSSNGSVRQQQLFQLLISNTSNLEKNWQINLNELLMEYMTEIGVTYTTEEDLIHLNFAEIGLVLQNSVQIYAKKIKLLEKEVLKLQSSLSYNAVLQQKELEERLTKDNQQQNEPIVEENNNIIQPNENVQPEGPPQKKSKNEKKIEEQQPTVESTSALIEAVINSSQEQNPTNIMDVLVPLLKKLTSPIQKRLVVDESELEEVELQSSLPIFTSVTKENRQICSELLLSLLNEPYTLSEVFRTFLTTNSCDQTAGPFAQVEEKKMLICKVMLLLEIRNKLKCNWRNDEDRLRIIDFLKPDLPSLTSVFDTPRSLRDDEFDFTFQSESMITSTPHPFEHGCANNFTQAVVKLQRLTDEEITFHVNKCKRTETLPDSKSVVRRLIDIFESEATEDGNFDDLLDEFTESPFSVRNPITVNKCNISNIFQIPKRLLKSTKSFQLPAELIMEEKLLRRKGNAKSKKPADESLKTELQVPVIKQEEQLDTNSVSSLTGDIQDGEILTQDSGIADVNWEPSTPDDTGNIPTESIDSAICDPNTSAVGDVFNENDFLANWDDSPEGDVLNQMAMEIKKQKEHEKQKQEMLQRVEEWKKYLAPKLIHSEERNYFNIHEYEDKVLDNFPKDGNKTTLNFHNLVTEQSGKEVSRYFSAVLQMANNRVVKLTKLTDNQVGSFAVDEFEVTNLSPVQNYESPAENIDSKISSIVSHRKRPFKH